MRTSRVVALCALPAPESWSVDCRRAYAYVPGHRLRTHIWRIPEMALGKCRGRWRGPQNPGNQVSQCLEISRIELRQAIHRIKDYNHLGGADEISIDLANGDVYDVNDELIGNIMDEV